MQNESFSDFFVLFCCVYYYFYVTLRLFLVFVCYLVCLLVLIFGEEKINITQ